MNKIGQFFEDARGYFNIFTVISLLSGFTLVSAPLVTRLLGWAALSAIEIQSLTFIYCICALGDYLLGIFINKMPSTLIADTMQNNLGGPATQTTSPNSTTNETCEPSPESVSPTTAGPV